MLRMHFTTADIAKLRITVQPDPLWELALSMHVLQVKTPDPSLGMWKRQTAQVLRAGGPRLAHRLALLNVLNPPIGYFPDFLTPQESSGGFEAGLAAVLATPARQLSREVAKVSMTRPDSAHAIASVGRGEPAALKELEHALRAYFQLALAPAWEHITETVLADRALRTAALATSGADTVLNGLSVQSRYHHGVLELHHYRTDVDVHLDGRGLLLVPSYFKEPETVMLLADPHLADALGLPEDNAVTIEPVLDPDSEPYLDVFEDMDDWTWGGQWNYDNPVQRWQDFKPFAAERMRLAQDIRDSMYEGGLYTPEQLLTRVSELRERGGLT